MGLSHDGDVDTIRGLPALVKNLCTVLNDDKDAALRDDKEKLAKAIANSATSISDALRSRHGTTFHAMAKSSLANMAAPGNTVILNAPTSGGNTTSAIDIEGNELPDESRNEVVDNLDDIGSANEFDDFQSTLQLL